MKRQRIYLDTSVIGGCFDPEFAPWSKGLMRDFKEGYFMPVVSDLVAAEIGRAPDFVQEVYAELLELGAQVLDASELDESLVSWNSRHIVRFDKIRRFNAANRELGYKEIEIYSPREVTRYEEP